MAVVLDSISPADTAVEVLDNTPVVIELSDSVDMTLAYVEILIGSKSYTVANGGLDYWSVKTESGGSIVDDLTSVTFATIGPWSEFSGAVHTVIVKYNSSTISTTTFTLTEFTQQMSTGPGLARFTTSEFSVPLTKSRAYYYIENIGTDRCKGFAYYYVNELIISKSGIYYYVAFPVLSRMPASAVVGEPISDMVPASTVVQAMTGESLPASVVVQGYYRAGIPASVVTGIVFRHGETASAIVGVETLTKIPASSVVYGVIRGSVLEISVIDDTTVTALTALGVTFS